MKNTLRGIVFTNKAAHGVTLTSNPALLGISASDPKIVSQLDQRNPASIKITIIIIIIITISIFSKISALMTSPFSSNTLLIRETLT